MLNLIRLQGAIRECLNYNMPELRKDIAAHYDLTVTLNCT